MIVLSVSTGISPMRQMPATVLAHMVFKAMGRLFVASDDARSASVPG
jgi:hypothetical protein